MINCLNFKIRIKSSNFDGSKRTTVSPLVYAVFPRHDVYMEVAMCIRLISRLVWAWLNIVTLSPSSPRELVFMGARRNFLEGGKTAWTDKNDLFSRFFGGLDLI